MEQGREEMVGVQRPEQIQSHLWQPWSTKYFTAKYMKGGECHLNIRGSETLTDSKSQSATIHVVIHRPERDKRVEWVG